MGSAVEVDPRALTLPASYIRGQVDDDLVRRYSEALEAGAKFPAIVAAEHDGDLVVLDGAHRRQAFIRRGLKTIPVEIVDVAPEQFVLEAVRRNAKHGTPLSAFDQERAVRMLRHAGVPFAAIVEATALPLHRLERMLVNRSVRPVVRSAAPPIAARTADGSAEAPGRGRSAAEGSASDPIERALVELTTGLERRDLGAVPPDILIAWYRRAALAVETLEKAIRRRGVSAIAR